MGSVVLEYTVEELDVPVNALLNELENGTTFVIREGSEQAIPVSGGALTWVAGRLDERRLILEVCDDFFTPGAVVEMLSTTFSHNLQDLGRITLERIDLSRSKYISKQAGDLGSFPSQMLGTIYKPYYHLTLADKVADTQRFLDLGLTIFKNDECFFCSRESLLEEAVALNEVVKGRGIFVPNLTSLWHDWDLVQALLNSGTTVVMLDFLVCGFKSAALLRERFPQLQIWGHRIGYRSLQTVLSMQALGTLCLASGINVLHVGTPCNDRQLRDQLSLCAALRAADPSFVPVFTKTSTAGIAALQDAFGGRSVYLACGEFRCPDNGTLDWDRVRAWSSRATR